MSATGPTGTVDQTDRQMDAPDEAYAFQRWVERTYARQDRPLTFRAQTADEWQVWRAALREKIDDLAGLAPPPEACDLSARVLEVSEVADGTVIREKIVYQSEPDVWVPAWLLRPNDTDGAVSGVASGSAGRLPAVLAVPGHGGHGGEQQFAGARQTYAHAARHTDRATTTNRPDRLVFSHPRVKFCEALLMSAS